MCTVQRAEYIVDHQLEHLDGLQELIEKLPIEHPLLVAARAWEIEQRKSQIEQEASTKYRELAQQFEKEESRLQTLQAAEEQKLQILQERILSTESELKTVQERLVAEIHKIEQAKYDFEQQQSNVEKFTDVMDERLAQLREQPLRLLADLQLATALPQAFFQPFSTTPISDAPGKTTALDRNQPKFFTGNVITTTTNLSTLPLAKVTKQYQTSITNVKMSVAAFLAGLIPVVDSAEDLTVLQVIAYAIVGQRIWSVPLSLTALCPLDLFGSVVNEQRMFVPVGDLADIVIEAQAHPDQLGIVLLEGVDRVPFYPVIAPLLQQYRTAREYVRQGDSMRSIQTPLRLFHPRSLAPNDPYQQLARLSWPANLLLAATFDYSPGSFSLPETYTPWFVPIEAPKQKQYIRKEQNLHGTDYSEIAPEQWYSSEKENFCQATNLSNDAIPAEWLLWQREFYVAMQKVGVKREKIEEMIERLWPQSWLQ